MKSEKKTGRRLNIALMSDFFYPNLGGVEIHQYLIGYCLIERGHKVIAITKKYNDRTGVRYLTNGIKTYHLPIQQIVGNITYPNLWFPTLFPLIRDIIIRENIDIIHIHQTTSTLGMMVCEMGHKLGVKILRTDHSLLSLNDLPMILAGYIAKFQSKMKLLDHVIAVSNAVRENGIIRYALPPEGISVIPNAIDSFKFPADPSKISPLGTVNIVFMARITHRKGVDLLIGLIPRVCKKYPKAYFIIGGNGNKDHLLKFLVEKHGLQDRVELLGNVHHSKVGAVLNRGHIFINTSISEAFCISALEAASAGLLVVTTNVGGTPEILPEDLLYLADPNVESLYKQVEKAMKNYQQISPNENHERIMGYYSWRNIAMRVEKSYYRILKEPKPKLRFRVKKLKDMHFMFLLMMSLFFVSIMSFVLDFTRPASSIEKAIDFDQPRYVADPDSFGDHQERIKVLDKLEK